MTKKKNEKGKTVGRKERGKRNQKAYGRDKEGETEMKRVETDDVRKKRKRNERQGKKGQE